MLSDSEGGAALIESPLGAVRGVHGGHTKEAAKTRLSAIGAQVHGYKSNVVYVDKLGVAVGRVIAEEVHGLVRVAGTGREKAGRARHGQSDTQEGEKRGLSEHNRRGRTDKR